MTIKGQVINCSVEKRALVGKDGVKRDTTISHVLLMSGQPGKDCEVVNLRSYDENFILPKIGTEFVTPPIKKYENFSGQVAEVMV